MSAIVDNQIQVRRYDLGQPFVRREQRMAFEAIHRTLAQTWSEAMTPQLPAGTALEFEGLDFAAFASASLDRSPCAQLTLFSIGEAVVPAFLMISGALARSLVNGKLGLKASGADQDATPFTGIEASVAREAMRTLLARLGEDYQAAGLGAIGNVRRCDNLVEGVQLAPEEPL
ncbi:MAG TPA: hypothetical protein VMT64_13675, partial [Candidatus Binataceae bacterium]|nr:hypothetical protein [Candidatus Binataceae bacterium]